MAQFFFDDSKHHRYGFSVAAFVAFESDPLNLLAGMFTANGFDISRFEFKSSLLMKDRPDLQALRADLKDFVQMNCKVGVAVVRSDEHLGSASINLLKNAVQHPGYLGGQHSAFFDQGFFGSDYVARRELVSQGAPPGCTFSFEQDSRHVVGLQLADLVAHTTSIMLLDAMGFVDKKIRAVERGDWVEEISLGFELWASLRYAFLSVPQKEFVKDLTEATVDVEPFGLWIDPLTTQEVAEAARKRFGQVYLGCIH